MGRRYVVLEDGKWVEPIKTGYRLGCCDCGLVHRINFRVRKGGAIQFQAFRDKRATAAKRRKRGATR